MHPPREEERDLMPAVGAAADASILFIVGGDEPERIARTGSKITITGSTDLPKLLQEREPYHRLHVTRNLLRQARRPDLDGYRVLVNLITEPESNSRVLETLRKLLRGVPGKVVNPPDAVLRSTRDQVARQLQGVPGLVVPATARLNGGRPQIAARALAKAGLEPPLILRPAGVHGGKIVGRFDTIEDLTAALRASGDFLATRFVDFRSADGLYRKLRVFFIGEHIILRHQLVSDEWNVHAKDRSRFMAGRPELVAEERALFERPEPFAEGVRAVLQAVRERIPLDFFGMDFGTTSDGEVVLFEANATMSFFPFSPDPQFDYLQRSFAPAQKAFRALLGLPERPPSGPPLQWRLEPA